MGRSTRTALLIMGPSLLGVAVFYYYPILQSFIYSLFRLEFTTEWIGAPFVGLGNYLSVLTDSAFLSALAFTLGFTAVVVLVDLSAGMLLAVASYWVHPKLRGIFRALIIIPWAIPNVIQASLWRWLLNAEAGVIGDLMVKIGLVGTPPLFLVNEWLAGISLVLVYSWKGAAIASLFLMAGLATIPSELKESALMDGAGRLRRFFSITVPVMWPTIFVALLYRTRDALRVFDVVFGLTRGGPGNATETLSTLAYRTYFGFNQYGMGSSHAIITFILVLAVSMIYLRRIVRTF